MLVIGLAAPLLGTKSPSEINLGACSTARPLRQTIRNDDARREPSPTGWAS